MITNSSPAYLQTKSLCLVLLLQFGVGVGRLVQYAALLSEFARELLFPDHVLLLECGVLDLQTAQQFAAGVGIVGQHRAAVHRIDEREERSGPSRERCASAWIYSANLQNSCNSRRPSRAQTDVEITSCIAADAARR